MTTASPAAAPTATASNLVRWTNRGLEALWLVTVFLVPLAFLDRNYALSEAVIAYVQVPKTALLRTLVGLMTILWLVEWAIQGRLPFIGRAHGPALGRSPAVWLARLAAWLRDQPTRWVYLAVWFFLGTTVLGTVLSASFRVSMWGEIPGQDSYPAYTVAAYVLLFAVIATHLKTRPQVWRLMGAIVVMGVLVGGYGVLQYYGHDFLDLMEITRNRVTSTMGNAIFAGAAMLLPIGVSLMAATISLPEPVRSGTPQQKARQWALVLALLALWVPVLAVQLLGLTFTFSRGPWLGTLLALVSFLGLTAIFVGWAYLGRAALVLGLASAVAFVAVPGTGPMFPIMLAAGLLGLAAVFVVGWRTLGRVALVLGLGVTLYAAVFLMPSWFSEGEGTAHPTGEVAQRFASIQGEVASGMFNERGVIWEGSWQLVRERPWFDFDSLSLPWLRPVVGYGPDLFRYVYLQVSPAGPRLVPMEPDHAHNYFIHQAVELGLLGLLSALGIYVVPFLVGVYQLVKKRVEYSHVHKLVLIGLLATLAGRFLEQMVGLARASDLTIFWVLLAMFVALPVAMPALRQPEQTSAAPRRAVPSRSRGPSRRAAARPYDWQLFWRLAVVAWLVGGICTLTWVKGVNYPRAAVQVAEGVQHFRQGDFRATLENFDRAIALAPDVPTYYSFRAAVYSAYAEYQDEAGLPREPECALQPQDVPYEACLAQKAYFSNYQGVAQRPFYWRIRNALAASAFRLKLLEEESIRLYRETTHLVPASWPLYNQLAAAYLEAGRPQEALEPLQKSLEITGIRREAANSQFLLGVACRDLGELEKALESLKLSLELQTSGPSARLAHQTLADVYTKLGQPDLAEEHQKRYEQMEAALR